MRKGIAVVLLAACSAMAARASDLTIKSKVSGEILGKKFDATRVEYFSATKMRSNDPEGKVDTLVDYDAQAFYTIQHDKKKITRTTFQDRADRLHALQNENERTPGVEELSKMLVGDVKDVRVDQLGKETVAGRSCDKVRVTVGKLGWEGSLDPSLTPPPFYAGTMQILQGAVPGPIGVSMRRIYEELAKMKGFPLKTHITGLMAADLTAEAIEISHAALPASTWVLPDYPIEDGGKKMKDTGNKH